MKVFIVYAYDDYYPERAPDQVKMVTDSKLKATLYVAKIKLEKEYDRVRVCEKEVY